MDGYTFLRWLRSGAAGAIPGQDGAGATTTRASFPVVLRVEGAGDVPRHVALHGPGDVVGLSPGQVVRRSPDPGATSADASRLAHVELDDPDLPWRYTPFHERTAADPVGAVLRAEGTLVPWLTLVVVEDQPGVTLGYTAGDLLPVLDIQAPAVPDLELPAIAELASWTHVQIAGDLPTTAEGFTALLDAEPHRTLARLVCPRLLAPEKPYLACLVPVFAAGRQAGLGEPVTATLDQRAWTAGDTGVRLPVYDSYRFATGPGGGGDFEALVRRLKHVHLDELVDDDGEPLIGTRPLDVTTPGFGVPDRPDPMSTPLFGALHLDGDDALTPVDPTLGNDITAAVDVADVVAPPVYGRWHAAAPVPGAAAWPSWLSTLNRSPGLRVAAGEGARLVQEHQEDFMAACWEQVGAISEANQLLRQAQLALHASTALHRRHVATLAPGPALQLLAPVLARVRSTTDPERTQWADIDDSCLPVLALSSHARRLLRSRGPLVRRIERWLNRDVIRRYDPTRLITTLADGDRLGPTPVPEPAQVVTLTEAAAGLGATGWPLAAPPAPDVLLLRQTLTIFAGRTAAPAACTPLDLDAASSAAKDAVHPALTVPRRARARLRLPAGLWDPPDRIDPIMVAPQITTPMYVVLAARGQDWMLPGLQHVPADSVSALAANQVFIEALLAGMNHEMSRELLWRAYPTDQRGSVFRHFWDRRVAARPPDGDVTALHTWAAGELGSHLPGKAPTDSFVFLLRGELLRRFPRASVMLVPAEFANGVPRPLPLAASALLPAFSGWLDPNVTFLGFDVDVNDVRGDNPATAARPGWFVVLQEQPTQPSFGVSGEAGEPGPDGRYGSWADLGVTDLAVIGDRTVDGSPVGYIDLAATTTAAFLERAPSGPSVWDGRSENLAATLLRRPFRFFLHGSDILPARTP